MGGVLEDDAAAAVAPSPPVTFEGVALAAAAAALLIALRMVRTEHCVMSFFPSAARSYTRSRPSQVRTMKTRSNDDDDDEEDADADWLGRPCRCWVCTVSANGIAERRIGAMRLRPEAVDRTARKWCPLATSRLAATTMDEFAFARRTRWGRKDSHTSWREEEEAAAAAVG